MPNPWDIKLVSDLTDHEMRDYAHYLEVEQTMEHEGFVDRAVEHVIDMWHDARDPSRAPESYPALSSDPEVFHLPTARQSSVWIGELTTVPAAPPILTSARYVKVRVPLWMDEKMARYVAREQILEQTEPDR